MGYHAPFEKWLRFFFRNINLYKVCQLHEAIFFGRLVFTNWTNSVGIIGGAWFQFYFRMGEHCPPRLRAYFSTYRPQTFGMLFPALHFRADEFSYSSVLKFNRGMVHWLSYYFHSVPRATIKETLWKLYWLRQKIMSLTRVVKSRKKAAWWEREGTISSSRKGCGKYLHISWHF